MTIPFGTTSLSEFVLSAFELIAIFFFLRVLVFVYFRYREIRDKNVHVYSIGDIRYLCSE